MFGLRIGLECYLDKLVVGFQEAHDKLRRGGGSASDMLPVRFSKAFATHRSASDKLHVNFGQALDKL